MPKLQTPNATPKEGIFLQADFLDSLEQLCFVASLDGVILHVNRATCTLLEYSLEELEGMHFLEIYSKEHRQAAEGMLADLTPQVDRCLPLMLLTKAGSRVPVETHTWIAEWYGEPCILGMSRRLEKDQELLQRFMSLFHANPTPMALSTAEDRVFYEVNQAFLDALGYQREEIIGQSSKILGLAADPAQHDKITDQLKTLGKISNIELGVIGKDGSLRRGLFSGELIHGQSQDFYLTVMVDITLIKEAQIEAQRAWSQTQKLLNAIPSGLLLVDLQSHKIAEINSEAERLIGVTREQVVGSNCPDISCPIDYQTCPFRGRGEPFQRETKLKTKAGESIPILLNEVEIVYNGRPHLLKSFFEVSALKKAEAQLREKNAALDASLEKIRELTDSISDVLWTASYNNNGKLIDSSLSKQAESFVGLPSASLDGNLEKFIAYVHPLDKTKLLSLLSTLVNINNSSMELEFRICTEQGQERWCNLRGQSVLQPSGETKLFGRITDISDHKEMEIETLQSFIALEEQTARADSIASNAQLASSTKNRFLAKISHDIRTPMNGVLGMTALLLRTELDSEQRRYTETIETSGNIVLQLVEDLLDIAKIEAGKLELESQPFCLRALLEEVASTLALKAQGKGLELISSVAPMLSQRLIGDATRLKQILVNLVANAVKFTERGEVELYAKATEGSKVHISVRDTGVGIPQEEQDQLFEEYSQLTHTKQPGSGLGLAISRELVAMMGGNLVVSSTPGRGSIFSFEISLPVEEDPQAPITSLEHLRVIFVDDNDTFRKRLRAQLESWGIEVSEHAEAASCLRELYSNSNYDVVLIDRDMPRMDGETLFRILANDPRFAQLHCALMSPLVSRHESSSLLWLERLPVLSKPLLHSELFDYLCSRRRRVFDKSRVLPIQQISTGASVLLVEDDPTNQLVARSMLRKLGIRAELANGGHEALEMVLDAKYDLIFMDIQMPDIDGLETTRRLRRLHDGATKATVPIVAMTAHAMKEDRNICLESGMTDYLSKPISYDELRRVLLRYLPSSSQEITPVSPSLPLKPVSQSLFKEQILIDRLMGDKHLAKQVLEQYLADLPVQLAELKESISAKAIRRTCDMLHHLKGAAYNIGATSFARQIATLELDAQKGRMGSVTRSLTEFDEHCQMLYSAIRDSSLLNTQE